MTGLELPALILAGVSAATGSISAASDVGRRKSKKTSGSENKPRSSSSRLETFTYTQGPASAYSNGHYSSSSSKTGGKACAGSKWYKSSNY